MAKKIKNSKLASKSLKSSEANISTKSAFNNHAAKIQLAKQKKIQKIGDTKARILSKKRENKMIRTSGNLKKIKKFALLDEDDERGNNQQRLTHKGVQFGNLKHFNDMNFEEDEFQENQIQKMQTNLNFMGFEEDQENNAHEGKHKTKTEIYKEIIEKSKKFKRERQELYEQNFQKAVELDENYQTIIPHLKFRNQVTKTKDKIQKTDKQYEKLINQLKDDQRVVANRVIVNDGKGKQKTSKRRNQQLKKLLKQNSDGQDEEDIRGWVKGVGEESQESASDSSEQDDSNQQGDNNDNEDSEESEQNNEEQFGEESQEDELDEIQLSSGDEQQEQDQNSDIRIVESESQEKIQSACKKSRKKEKKEIKSAKRGRS